MKEKNSIEINLDNVNKIKEIKESLSLVIRDVAGAGASTSVVTKILSGELPFILKKDTYKSLLKNMRKAYFEKLKESQRNGNTEDISSFNYANKLLLELEYEDSGKNLNIKAPGGKIHGHINYIERDCDLQLIMYSHEPLIFLRGGIKSGKSSCLYNYKIYLDKNASNKTIIIDFSKLQRVMGAFIKNAQSQEFSPKHIFTYIIYEIYRALEHENAEIDKLHEKMYPVDEQISSYELPLIDNLETVLNELDGIELFLIIDGVDSIYKSAWGNYGDIFFDFIIEALNQNDVAPFNRLHIISTLSARSSTYARNSGIEQQAPNIFCSDLNEKGVKELVKIYGLSLDDLKLAEIKKIFSYQPFLVHTTLNLIQNGHSIEDIKDNHILSDVNFKRYIESLKNSIYFIFKELKLEDKKPQILNSLIDNSNKKNDDNLLYSYLAEIGLSEPDSSSVKSEFISILINKNLL
jgi:hypothetical protein